MIPLFHPLKINGWNLKNGVLVQMTSWLFENIVHFHLYLGKIPILTHIFQMGWNFQPVFNIGGFLGSIQIFQGVALRRL